MLDNKGKNTDTHSECVMLIAFRRQQWLREHASVLSYTYVPCLLGYLANLYHINHLLVLTVIYL
jgi:hypothetical protein